MANYNAGAKSEQDHTSGDKHGNLLRKVKDDLEYLSRAGTTIVLVEDFSHTSPSTFAGSPLPSHLAPLAYSRAPAA